jgi:predicted kinase
MLIVISGLPGVGKTTLAKRLAKRLSAFYLRADTIESALVEAGFSLGEIGGAGYQVAARTARENLRLGHDMIIDCVNPWPLTREMWRAAAREANSPILEVEVVCSDPAEHRRRVESRISDMEGLQVPTWQQVVERDYQPWDVNPLRVDTAKLSTDEAVDLLIAGLAASRSPETRAG